MEAKSCFRSQGQPVSGVRSAAMISRRREMSREGVTFYLRNRVSASRIRHIMENIGMVPSADISELSAPTYCQSVIFMPS